MEFFRKKQFPYTLIYHLFISWTRLLFSFFSLCFFGLIFMHMRTNDWVIAQSFFISSMTSDPAAPLARMLLQSFFLQTKLLLGSLCTYNSLTAHIQGFRMRFNLDNMGSQSSIFKTMTIDSENNSIFHLSWAAWLFFGFKIDIQLPKIDHSQYLFSLDQV